MSELKISIVGTSAVASRYVHILKRCNDVSIESVYSRTLERAKEFASGQGIKYFVKWTGSCLEGARCDAVIICTEPSRHIEAAIAALDAGKHVMIEKPLDIDMNRARALMLRSKTAGKIISVVSQRRFEPALIRMNEKIDSIRQESPLMVQLLTRRSNSKGYYQRGNGWRLKYGAIFLEQDIHWIDILHWFFGKPVKVFSISHKTREFLECPDSTAAIIEFNKGDIAIIAGSGFNNEPKSPQFIIYGKGGTLDYQKMRRLSFLKKTISSIAKRLGIMGAFNEDPMSLQVLDFIHAIRDNRQPLTTLENAYQSLMTALKISSLEDSIGLG